MSRPIPAEHWFSLGRTVAYCQKRLKWMAAPGYKLEHGHKSYCIDGQEFPVKTVSVIADRGERE